jgi:hypothetical protein
MSDPTAPSITFTDAVYDLALDNLALLARSLKARGETLATAKADKIIEQLNQCLGGRDEPKQPSKL